MRTWAGKEELRDRWLAQRTDVCHTVPTSYPEWNFQSLQTSHSFITDRRQQDPWVSSLPSLLLLDRRQYPESTNRQPRQSRDPDQLVMVRPQNSQETPRWPSLEWGGHSTGLSVAWRQKTRWAWVTQEMPVWLDEPQLWMSLRGKGKEKLNSVRVQTHQTHRDLEGS